jgi:REP element-mobilizing transposase RayT
VLEDRHGQQTHESCGLRDQLSLSVGTQVSERDAAPHAARTGRGIIARDCQDFGFEIDTSEVAVDHVHLFLDFPPRYSIAKVVRILKSISASQVVEEFPQLRKQLWARELWEGGYFARTVGDKVTAEVIRRYIRQHQGKTGQQRQLKVF